MTSTKNRSGPFYKTWYLKIMLGKIMSELESLTNEDVIPKSRIGLHKYENYDDNFLRKEYLRSKFHDIIEHFEKLDHKPNQKKILSKKIDRKTSSIDREVKIFVVDDGSDSSDIEWDEKTKNFKFPEESK